VNPRVYIATKDVFTIGNRKGFDNVDDKIIMKAIQQKDIKKFVGGMHNALQDIAVAAYPDIGEAEQAIKDHFGESGLVMTGSGSTFIKFLVGDETGIDDFIAIYRDKYFISIFNFL